MLEPVNPLTTVDAHPLCRAGGLLHLFDGTLVDAVGIAVTPDVVGQDALVSRVDLVENGLADQVAADGEDLLIVFLEGFALLGTVVILGHRLVDLEMVAPAGQLHAVETELLALASQFFRGQVSPLARAERYRSCHVKLLLSVVDLVYVINRADPTGTVQPVSRGLPATILATSPPVARRWAGVGCQ